MQTPIPHWEGNHDHRRRTAGPEGPRSRRFSSAAAVVADIALAALAAALIVFLGDLALDLIVAILVLVAAVAAVATRPVQAFRGRAELDLLRQPLRPDLRPHLLQLLNYALLAALILIATLGMLSSRDVRTLPHRLPERARKPMEESMA